MQTWTFGRHPAMPGPWADEPDKAQWIDPKTDLDCMLLRNHYGVWCGYVGLPPGHRYHGVDYRAVTGVDVHGQLTFARSCAADEPLDGICHLQAADRPADIWWLGFDCGHLYDFSPEPALSRLFDEGMDEGAIYRTFEYAQDEVTRLARQLAVKS